MSGLTSMGRTERIMGLDDDTGYVDAACSRASAFAARSASLRSSSSHISTASANSVRTSSSVSPVTIIHGTNRSGSFEE